MALESGEVIEGRVPRNAARLVREWTLAHPTNSWIIGSVRGSASLWSALQDWFMIKVVGVEFWERKN